MSRRARQPSLLGVELADIPPSEFRPGLIAIALGYFADTDSFELEQSVYDQLGDAEGECELTGRTCIERYFNSCRIRFLTYTAQARLFWAVSSLALRLDGSSPDHWQAVRTWSETPERTAVTFTRPSG